MYFGLIGVYRIFWYVKSLRYYIEWDYKYRIKHSALLGYVVKRYVIFTDIKCRNTFMSNKCLSQVSSVHCLALIPAYELR